MATERAPLHSCIQVVAALCLSTALYGCGESTRSEECGRYPDWSNGLGTEIDRLVPSSRLSDESTPTDRAAWFHDRADAIRQVASRPTPFTDPVVRGYAEREVAALRQQADALDAEGDAWAVMDSAGVQAAIAREQEAMRLRGDVTDEWMSHCRE